MSLTKKKLSAKWVLSYEISIEIDTLHAGLDRAKELYKSKHEIQIDQRGIKEIIIRHLLGKGFDMSYVEDFGYIRIDGQDRFPRSAWTGIEVTTIEENKLIIKE